MKLSKNNQIIIAVVLIVLIVIGLKVFSAKTAKVSNVNNLPLSVENQSNVDANANSEISNGKIKSVDVPAPTTVYVSKEDGFAVNFPTVPKVENTIYKSSSAGSIPLTEYTQDYASGGERAWYKIAVYHFPVSYQFTDSFLDESADVYIGSVRALHPGARVADHQKTQFLGNPAITGTVTVPVKLDSKSAVTTDTNNYATMTVKGKNLYIISTYGMTQDNFDAFINSFKFQ